MPRPIPADRELRFNRHVAIATLLRRTRREAGLSYRHVSTATMIDGPRLYKYESAHQYPSVEMADRILEAIDRLEKDGVGNPARAAEAKAEYAEEDEAAAGTGQ